MSNTGNDRHSVERNGINRREFFNWTTGTVGAIAVAYSLPSLSCTSNQPTAATGDPIVETSNGKVRGYTADGVCTFRGIRYGASTMGKNRFQPPRKPDSWTGVRDATSYGYSAPQTNPSTRGVAGPESSPMAQIMGASDGFRATPAESEDCLFLNVWTAGLSPDRKRPVMVWLHGGGYSMGTASSLLYDGTNLARRGDVVVVGVNHRLNAFGYTHFGDIGGQEYAHSGNVGQLDIVAALQWVRDNIDRFGGDPNRVMIFGESGGGGKVSMLLASPPAKGLFHRAVIESGPGVKMGEREPATKAAEMLLAELKLDAGRLPEIHKLPTDAILSAYFAVTAALARQPNPEGRGFAPVLDPVDLPAHPYHPTAPRVSEDVPVMVGWNKTESTVFSFGDEQAFALDEAGMRKRIEPLVGADADRLIQLYKTEFPKLSPSGIYFYVSSYSMMGSGSITIAERKAAIGKAPAYLYRLDWETPIDNGRLICPHGLEMPLVFDNVDRGGEGLTGGVEEARKLAAAMSETWVTFAATGNPNSGKSGLPQWPPYDSEKRATMVFDTESKIVSDPQKEQRLIFEKTSDRT